MADTRGSQRCSICFWALSGKVRLRTAHRSSAASTSSAVEVKFQQRYVRSHTVFDKSQSFKDIRREARPQHCDLLRKSTLGARFQRYPVAVRPNNHPRPAGSNAARPLPSCERPHRETRPDRRNRGSPYRSGRERLTRELNEVVGNRLPTTAEVPRLTYTKMVWEESLPLYPPA